MTYIIAQETPQGRYYITSVNARGEFVLGSKELREARKFPTEEEAQKAVDRTHSPKAGVQLVELDGPNREYRASTPLGFVLQACTTEKIENLEQLRAAIPPHISADLNDEELWGLVHQQTELLLDWPWTVDLLLMQRHVLTHHHRSARFRKRHNHPAERNFDTDEIVRPSKQGKHGHEDDLERLGKEVRNMGTTTKARPKAAKREKKEKVLNHCHCGCGGETFANFMPGHDARIYALFRKRGKGEKNVKFPAVLTDNEELFAEMSAKAH